MKLKSPYVITINRQFGSGGAYIGQNLARRLNIIYADRDIIDRAAKQLSVMVEDLESHEEKIGSFWQKYMRSFAVGSPEVYLPPHAIIPTDNELFETESRIIRQIAMENSAVIIGRCGCHVLADHPDRLSIFLHADEMFRAGQISEKYNLTVDDALKMLRQNDRERAQYYKTFTGREWTDARQYDISIDTQKAGLDNVADIIVRCLEC